jgi:hypothetical protein
MGCTCSRVSQAQRTPVNPTERGEDLTGDPRLPISGISPLEDRGLPRLLKLSMLILRMYCLPCSWVVAVRAGCIQLIANRHYATGVSVPRNALVNGLKMARSLVAQIGWTVSKWYGSATKLASQNMTLGTRTL